MLDTSDKEFMKNLIDHFTNKRLDMLLNSILLQKIGNAAASLEIDSMNALKADILRPLKFLDEVENSVESSGFLFREVFE